MIGEKAVLDSLWDRWINPPGEEFETFTILTTKANEHVFDIHHRMPVIDHPNAYASWLDPATRHNLYAEVTGSVCRRDAAICCEYESQPGRERRCGVREGGEAASAPRFAIFLNSKAPKLGQFC